MLAALRRAGSALPRHAPMRMRALQSRRRCLPAEPDLPPPTLDKLADVVQTEPARRRETWPDGREGANMARGQFLTVAVIGNLPPTVLQAGLCYVLRSSAGSCVTCYGLVGEAVLRVTGCVDVNKLYVTCCSAVGTSNAKKNGRLRRGHTTIGGHAWPRPQLPAFPYQHHVSC